MGIRVFIVEDHPVMRQSLHDYLSFVGGIEPCGEAASAEEATAAIEDAAPSVVLVDLSLPDRSGLELLREIGARWQLPCVVLTGHGESTHVDRAFSAGARGYVLKGVPEDVAAAVRTVAGGGVFVSRALAGYAGQDEAVTGA